MEDNRKLKRRHLIYYLRIFERDTGNLVGHLVDITNEGLMIISEEPIEAQTTFQFRMDLPSGVKQKKQMDFSAKSIWSKKDINPDFYETGFLLLNIADDDVEIIEKLVKDFGFRD